MKTRYYTPTISRWGSAPLALIAQSWFLSTFSKGAGELGRICLMAPCASILVRIVKMEKTIVQNILAADKGENETELDTSVVLSTDDSWRTNIPHWTLDTT